MITGMANDNEPQPAEQQVLFLVACQQCKRTSFQLYRWTTGPWLMICDNSCCPFHRKPVELTEALFRSSKLLENQAKRMREVEATS